MLHTIFLRKDLKYMAVKNETPPNDNLRCFETREDVF